MVPDWVIASGSRRRDFKARSGSIAGVKAAQGRKNDEHQDAKKKGRSIRSRIKLPKGSIKNGTPVDGTIKSRKARAAPMQTPSECGWASQPVGAWTVERKEEDEEVEDDG